MGARLSYGGMLTTKYFYADQKAAEGIISFRWSGVIFTGLLEWQRPLAGSSTFSWYYGGGFQLGLHSADTEFEPELDYKPKTYVLPGIDGILGLEYSFAEMPFSLSLDWKPAIIFTGSRDFIPEGVGLSLRYVLPKWK